MFTNRGKALTFDDILLIPGYSEVTPDAVDLSTYLTPEIPLRIPLLSAAMEPEDFLLADAAGLEE